MLNSCDLKITLLYYSILTLVQIQCMPTWNRSWNTCSHVLLNCIIITSPCGQEKFYFLAYRQPQGNLVCHLWLDGCFGCSSNHKTVSYSSLFSEFLIIAQDSLEKLINHAEDDLEKLVNHAEDKLYSSLFSIFSNHKQYLSCS